MINAAFQSINEKFFINITKLSNLLMENKFCEIEEMLYDDSSQALFSTDYVAGHWTPTIVTSSQIISYRMSLLHRFGSLIFFLSFS